MITSLTIENFRGIQSGKLEDLGLLTALVGPNNSGKSTVLEALQLAGTSGLAARFVLPRRGWYGPEALRYVTFRKVGSFSIQATGRLSPGDETETSYVKFIVPPDAAGDKVRLWLWYGQEDKSSAYNSVWGDEGMVEGFDKVPGTPDPRPARWVKYSTACLLEAYTIKQPQTLENLWTEACERGKDVKTRLKDLCQLFRPGMTDLEILKSGEAFVLFIEEAKAASPLLFAGDGMKRLFHIACKLAARAGGLVFIEEPESFLHPKAQIELVKLLWGAVGQGTQIVFSTHSMELLQQVFQATEGRDLGQAALYRTYLKDGQFQAGRIAGPEAAERLNEVSQDLRQ